MSRMQHETWIAREPQAVFDYTTRPTSWLEWHPAALGFQPGADRPLRKGERFEEDVRTAGGKGRLSWLVEECERPLIWAARAKASNGAIIFVRYRYAAKDDGTVFQRELEYQLPNLFLRLLDVLILRRRFDAESKLSLQKLKQALEAS